MNRTAVGITIVLPLLVTGLALAAVARNRAAGREPIVLSEREVALVDEDADNTFRALWLSWQDARTSPDTWFDREKLASLGFDTSVDPASAGAEAHYQRMLQRDAYVAFELNGPAWQSFVSQPDAGDLPRPVRAPGGDIRDWGSRLVAVDASIDGETLAARYPDGRTHLVTAAVVWVRLMQPRGRPPYLAGVVSNITPNRIHVPSRWASSLPSTRPGARPRFTVSVQYGARFEPWVVGVNPR